MDNYGLSATVGAWEVCVDPVNGVTAGKRGSNETFSASLTRFPTGYRVGPWTNGVTDCTRYVPKAVQARARALARQLDSI